MSTSSGGIAAVRRLDRDTPLSAQEEAALAAVRATPADAKLRIYLAQLSMVTGRWQRAVAQLQVAAQLDAAAIPMAQTYREAIRAELMRERVMRGEAAPESLGQPAEWFALLVQALKARAGGEHALADDLQGRAFEAAEPTAFVIDGVDEPWLADADTRFGPVCEVVLNGRYFWIPFDQIEALELAEPGDLRDLVWTAGQLTLSNGGQHPVLLPVRYPDFDEDHHALAAMTSWQEAGAAGWLGRGQRMWCGEGGEYPLLNIRHVERAAATT